MHYVCLETNIFTSITNNIKPVFSFLFLFNFQNRQRSNKNVFHTYPSYHIIMLTFDDSYQAALEFYSLSHTHTHKTWIAEVMDAACIPYCHHVIRLCVCGRLFAFSNMWTIILNVKMDFSVFFLRWKKTLSTKKNKRLTW